MSRSNLLSASVVAGGSGGTNGTQTVNVVGGKLAAGGSPAQLSVTVSGGAVTAVLSVVYGGDYVGLPVNPVQVSGASLNGATLSLSFSGGNDDFLT